MITFDASDILQMDKYYRIKLINSIVGYKSVALIGTLSKEGLPNLAIFSNIFHMGSKPPLIGILVRPASVPRHTFANILDHKFFTINHIHEEILTQAHQTSARYQRLESEFEAVGLTAEYRDLIPAPYVGESKLKLGMTLEEVLPVKTNDTNIIVGEVKEIVLPDHVLQADGFVSLEKAGSVAGSGLDAYHHTTLIKRLTFAKPDQPATELL